MKILDVFLVIIFSGFLVAQPVITNTNGIFNHDSNIIITGSNFGSKNPAQPLLWDDCTLDTSLSFYYSQYLPTSAQQGAFYNIQYRSVPFRNTKAPNEHINYVIAGAHATDNSSGQYLSGNNVCLGINLSSFDFFAQYWYRVDSLYDIEIHPTQSDNMKEISIGSAPGEIYTGDHGYFNWCNNLVPTVNQRAAVKVGRMPVDCPSLPYACSEDQYTTYHLNPINGWIKMQWEGGYNHNYDNPILKLTTYPDGAVTEQSHYGTDITVSDIYVGCGYPNYNDLRFLGIGGFSRVPRQNDGQNSFRYFAAVYVDSVKSRVMLGDNSDYFNCSILEPQIPLTWSDNSISVKINLGSLDKASDKYLFVFNKDNEFNPTGYLITQNNPVPLSQPKGVDIVK